LLAEAEAVAAEAALEAKQKWGEEAWLEQEDATHAHQAELRAVQAKLEQV